MIGKFQRKYKLTVQGKSGNTYVIQDPLTVIFDINRRSTGAANTGHFMLYNLSPDVRNDVQYDNAFDGVGRPFQFSAGYASEGYQTVLYKGTLQRALSYREGPDVITEITVLDGGEMIQKSQIELTLNYPWDPKAASAQIIQTMGLHGVTFGAIGSLFNRFKRSRGITWIGSTWDILRKLAVNQKGYACVDLEKVYMLAQNDVLVIPGTIQQLDSGTGLIGTPRRTNYVVDAQMLFEPRVQLLQSLKLVSTINPNVNGTYSVQAVGHRGIISASKDGGAITSLSLMTLPENINQVAVP